MRGQQTEPDLHGVKVLLWKWCLKMAAHFSANQYEQAFAAQRLQNWEVPKNFKERPSTLEGFTQPISNDRGHILPGIPRSRNSPWGDFVGTWDLSKSVSKSKQVKTKTSKDTSPEKIRCSLELKDDKPPASPRSKDVPSPEAKTRASPVTNEQRAESPVNIRASPVLTGSPREKENNETTEVC